MTFDLSSPFYQQLIQQGRAAGYGDIPIAAALGSASIENGGKTSGIPGDQGVKDGLGAAFGGFQWRGDRFDNLKALSSGNGSAWTDPKNQAAYFWAEQGGKYGGGGTDPESLAQFKNATSLDDANDAMVDYLRPGGWKGGSNNSATVPTYSARLAASQAALAAMGGKDGSGGGGGASDADMPATGATAVSGGGTPPGTPITVGQWQAPQVQQPVQAPRDSLGSHLLMAGAALMARDNPSGASTLSGMVSSQRNNDLQAAQLQASQVKNTQQQWKDEGVVGDGKYIRQTDQQGNQRYVPVPEAAQETAESKTAKKSDMQLFQQNDDSMSTYGHAVDSINVLKDGILSGKVKMSMDAQGKAYIRNMSGMSDENARSLKNAEAYINIAIRNVLAQEKGPATDMKMKQAMQQILPKGGEYDNAQVYDALDRLTDGYRSQYANAANANRRYVNQYPDLGKGNVGVDGKPMDLGAHWDANLGYWTDQQGDFDKRKPGFLAAHDGRTNTKAPSLLDIYDQQNGPAQRPQSPADPYAGLALGPM